MNNYLHKTNKGDLYMYDLIAIVYKLVLITLGIILFYYNNELGEN